MFYVGSSVIDWSSAEMTWASTKNVNFMSWQFQRVNHGINDF